MSQHSHSPTGNHAKPRPDNLEDPDGFYEMLMGAHEGLTDDQSQLLNARLILVLANEVGEKERLADCIASARRDLPMT